MTRLPLEVFMRLQLPGVTGMDHAETRNVSARGIYLHTRAPLVAGQDLECVLVLPQDLTRTPGPMYVGCRGKVVRVHERLPGQKLGAALEISGYDFSWPEGFTYNAANETDVSR
jgi:hypothetical protein